MKVQEGEEEPREGAAVEEVAVAVEEKQLHLDPRKTTRKETQWPLPTPEWYKMRNLFQLPILWAASLKQSRLSMLEQKPNEGVR